MKASNHAVFIAMLFVTVLVLAPAAARADVDRGSFEKSRYPAQEVVDVQFPADEGGTLHVDVDDVDVWIKESMTDRVTVKAYVSGPDEDEAREYFEEHIGLEVKKDGNKFKVFTSNFRGHWGFNRHHNIRVWAIISVPRDFDADIYTADGDLIIDALEGYVDIATEDGDMDIEMLGGPEVDVKTADGDMHMNTIDAEHVSIRSADGDVRAKTVKGKRVEIASSDGDMTVERVEGGTILLKTSDGNIDVGATGDELTVKCSDGDVIVNLFGAMAVDLTAHDGDIELKIPHSIDADLDLKAEDVHLARALAISGRITDRRVVGSINNGGPLVKAKTNDGSIEVDVE